MKKILTFITVILVGIGLGPLIVNATTMEYSVKTVIPENQIDKTLTYYDLKMEPNQKQELTLVVSNSSNEEATILITPNVALTNQNGVIDYSQEKGKKDSTLLHPLTSLISGKQEVTLAPNESKNVQFTVQMPKEKIEGLILGGFYIIKKDTAEKSAEKEKEVQIKNNYSYVVGLKIREDEQEIKPKVVLNDIKPTLLNYRTTVTANIQNTEATMIKDMDVEAQVFKKGSSTVLHEMTKKGLSMAPNSNFDIPINWDNERLEPGKYQLKLVATSGENKWRFNKEFTIKATESNKLNKEAVELEKPELNWLVIIICVAVGMVLLISVIIFFIHKHKKKKEQERLARIRRKKKKQQMKKRQRISELENKNSQKSK